ncbi:helix-turn-helix domain-containing protein [Muricauda sp. JGD-17]|uniref:Helix-turn-helix domain-containing protein n=2 Tax=Flagellimonas ochracea TaxID=2696472 RepID=A0A964TB36_9FLAO|nr:helix-turn-helix domain-containing protein [Allomuricauda ochracea]
MSQTDLANQIGVSLRTIQLYEKKNANIPIKNLTKIAEYFEMTIAELYLREVNDMDENYIRKQPFIKHGSVFYPLDHGKYLVMVPLVLMEQHGSYLEKLEMETAKKTPFQIGFVVDFLEDATYMAFEIAGDAMNNQGVEAIPNKAIALGVEIKKGALGTDNTEMWNKSYVLVCKDRIICKDIIGYDKNRETVQCHNLNTSPEYKDFDLSLNDILQVFRIVKKQL